MVDPLDSDGPRMLRYDVQLTCRPPDSLRARYPDMTVRTMEAQTALRRRIDSTEELDALLHEIGNVGLTLTGLHRVAGIDRDEDDGGAEPDVAQSQGPASAVYEVRVAGELGEPLLRHLGCSHYSVPQPTLVRLALVAAEVNRFLRVCADSGATLEWLRRVDPQPMTSSG